MTDRDDANIVSAVISDSAVVWPKISIVTPSFNQGEFIEETILSVLNQNYPNLEYIIMDGGSTDATVNIIKKYEDRLTYWVSEKDEGQYDAIDKGFKKCTGEIMSYINSDDVFTDKSFFSVAQIFIDYPEIEWMGGVPNHIDEIGRCVWVDNKPRWNRFKYLKKEFKYIQQEGVFWRKNLWLKSGSYISTQYSLASDLELWSRFFAFSEFYIFPGILGSFRVRSSNQKSLELMGEYHQEVEFILTNMVCTKEELQKIKCSYTLLYRLLRKLSHQKLWQIFGYSSIRATIEKYPNELYFDRKLGKFILNK